MFTCSAIAGILFYATHNGVLCVSSHSLHMNIVVPVDREEADIKSASSGLSKLMPRPCL